MKKIKALILFLFLVLSVKSQITYEQSYPFVGSSCMNRIQLSDIGNGDFKFYYTCYSSNELRIFNLDHSSYRTISVPILLNSPGDYEIGYVSKDLFDCDSTLIEYAIMPSDLRKNFYIFREDGTLLFERDSTIAPYTLAQSSGSFDSRPIMNTPSGTKLFLAKNVNGNLPFIDVYSLCGTLPLSINKTQGESFVQVFPSPSKSIVHFKLRLPDNFEEYQITIFNDKGQVVSKVERLWVSDEFDFNAERFGAGIYYFELRSKSGKNIKSGKFIITY